jgi:hypothetical protein
VLAGLSSNLVSNCTLILPVKILSKIIGVDEMFQKVYDGFAVLSHILIMQTQYY